MRKLIAFLFWVFAVAPLSAQTHLYNEDTIQVIDITFPDANWDYMLDTAKLGSDGYILATQVIVNGVMYDSVGVRFKGNSSYDSAQSKNPLHIKLDYTHGSYAYDNVTDIKLGNGFSDPSCIREILSYRIIRNYMAAPLSNFARVTINGFYYGLFSNTQSIDADFLSDKFYSSENTFFKCNPQNVVSGQIPNLLYLGDDSTLYFTRYELKSMYGWNDLVSLCDTLANAPGLIDTILDVDRVLWMIAFNNVTVNLDSYSGAYAQNYYLYRDDNGRFDPIMWDVNMCFGAFTNTGTSNLNIAGEQQLTPLLHSTYGGRPLIMNLLADTTYQKMYIAHMRTITDEFFTNAEYDTLAAQYQSLIDSSAQVDLNSVYSYAQFQAGMTSNVGVIPGISNLMDARVTYLNGTTQFQYVPPVISTVLATPSVASLNDSVWITCNASNAANVYLGYRDQLWKRFYRVNMYDDGLHQDGTTGDGIYGAYMIATSGMMQYYVYAENNDAGVFSPARAEYEFYTVLVSVATAGTGEVVINELLSSNTNNATDASGTHEDWIELFNNTNNPLGLYGLYLTDDVTNHFKFPLPDVIINPYDVLIVWADSDPSSTSEIHANFHLSAAGETLLLCNNSGVVLDSVTFPALNTDNSYGRCPNGYGSFIVYSYPSWRGWNVCPGGVEENNTALDEISLYPDPAVNSITLVSTIPSGHYSVISIEGKLCTSGTFDNSTFELNVTDLREGMYFIQLTDAEDKITLTKKFAVLAH